ncbi:MAG: type II toxin-antitoxin system HipA family toxin [Parvibaculaceae bacterium]
MSRALDVHLHDLRAGELVQADDGALTFAYVDSYLTSRGARAISVSMPLRQASWPDRVARPFFSGLLPDGDARQRLAGRLGISAANTFGLLEVIGGECAGALSLHPQGKTSLQDDGEEVEPLRGERLANVLGRLHDRPLLGGEDGVRLSLAGAQDKLAVCIESGEIGLAKGGRATTHILKPAIRALEGTVENELFCLRLARRMKLAAPEAVMREAEGTPFLLVERYDRRQGRNGTIERLHQEDFCQALSVPPELKYEDEGGPGTESSLGLIQRATARPAAERLAFIRMLIFDFLVGNADAHAKNFALLYREKVPDLAPPYDVVCTAVYPRLAQRLAMAIGGRNIPDTIRLDHWLKLVPPVRSARQLLVKDLMQMASRIEVEADAVRVDLDTEGVGHAILDRVRAIIASRAAHILRITHDG